MIDLDEALARATRNRQAWDANAVRRYSQRVVELVGGVIEWQLETGAEWIRIIKDNDVVMLIRVRTPFVFVLDRYEEEAVEAFASGTPLPLALVAVSSFDAQSFCASAGALAEAFPERALSPTLDTNYFSPFDLWFASS